MSPRKMCGGGSSLGSDQPNAQQASQMPAKRPTDRHDHNAAGAARRTAAQSLADRSHSRPEADSIPAAAADMGATRNGSGNVNELTHHPRREQNLTVVVPGGRNQWFPHLGLAWHLEKSGGAVDPGLRQAFGSTHQAADLYLSWSYSPLFSVIASSRMLQSIAS